MSSALTVSFNGVCQRVEALTLHTLLLEQGFDVRAALACAVNGSFVPRSEWVTCELQPHDRIDVVAPVTGG